MRKLIYQSGIILLLILNSFGCNTTKKTSNSDEKQLPEVVVTPEEEITDNVALQDTANPSPKIYQPSSTKVNDLLHTKLDVKFDWSKQYILGKATLTFKPYFYPTDMLVLDAKSMEIKSVVFEGTTKALNFKVNENKLTIELGKKFNRTEKYTLVIDYIGKPNEGAVGGSAAITEDKGLYFINPTGEDESKPMQIWTQGETESNSHWFPTIDKPNEKTTSEIYMTVEDKYKTLSNGLMESSRKNADGTRTDHWVMDKPHAVYLLMMAIGDFAIVKEKWNNIDLMYYVEPKYERYAKTIYKNTPELLSFFSSKLGVNYPWQKYAQVIVRDYVSGAMENTTAVIFGEFMNGTDRELIDVETNELVVAHEMFHHWFGDYVTAESWSNLTVNESFANYSEYLWTENKYGADAADRHLLEQYQGYFGQSKQRMHPLVDFYYEDKEQMFDAHSYNKGGCILHMLRNYVGDEAFFSSLNKYLMDNAYGTGEAHQLRLAFESVTGEDLNWFWNQWYYNSGHPILEINQNYDKVAKRMIVTVNQTQNTPGVPSVFRLPVKIDIHTKGGIATYKEMITEKTTTFSYDTGDEEPLLVVFDADRVILCERTEKKTIEQYAYQYANSKKYQDRMDALVYMGENKSNPIAMATFQKALGDKFWELRQIAVESSDPNDAFTQVTLKKLAETDSHSKVRATAVNALATLKDIAMIPLFNTILNKEQAYPVLGDALRAIHTTDENEGLLAIKKMEKETNSSIISAIGSIYSSKPDISQIPFYENSLKYVDGENAIGFVGKYAALIGKLDKTEVIKKAEFLTKTAQTAPSPWVRFAAAKGILDIRKNYKAVADSTYMEFTKMLETIKNSEKNAQLKQIYEQVLTK